MILAVTPAQTSNVDWSSLFSRMGWIDAIFLLAFALGVFFGLRKGFAKVFPGLFGVAMAQTIAIEYSASSAALFQAKLNLPPQILHGIFFAGFALACILLVRFVCQFLALLVSVEFRPPINNIGAAIFGGVKFLLFLSLISSFAMFFPPSFIQRSLTEGSVSGPYLVQMSQQVHDFVIQWIPNAWRAR